MLLQGSDPHYEQWCVRQWHKGSGVSRASPCVRPWKSRGYLPPLCPFYPLILLLAPRIMHHVATVTAVTQPPPPLPRVDTTYPALTPFYSFCFPAATRAPPPVAVTCRYRDVFKLGALFFTSLVATVWFISIMFWCVAVSLCSCTQCSSNLAPWSAAASSPDYLQFSPSPSPCTNHPSTPHGCTKLSGILPRTYSGPFILVPHC